MPAATGAYLCLGILLIARGGLAVDSSEWAAIADARAANRPPKRHAGNCQRRRNGNHGNNIRIVFQVVAEHGGDYLRFVFKSFYEKRAYRPVDEA